MKRTSRTEGSNGPPRRPHSRDWLSALVIALMLSLAFGGPAALPLAQMASAQDTANPTPDPANQGQETPVAPRDPTAPQSQETPEPENNTAPEGSDNQQSQGRASAQVAQTEATGPGAPAVLAHGLAYVSGDQVVWQVRETDIPDISSAQPSSSNAAVMLQRDGSTIIRNDVTGKRAKLNPGDAYFRAADDPYTAMADSSGSVAWTFELVLSNAVANDAFYESPLINDLQEGVYSMTLTRYVLRSGESAPLPPHTGPALIMVSTGEIEVEDDSGLSTLAESDGQLMPGDGTVTNASGAPAVYVVAALGDEVSDESAGAPQAQTTPVPTEAAGEETSTATEAPAETDSEAPVEAAPDASGEYQTSINVTANAEIYLVITADGTTVFDGYLPAGSSSGPVVGSVFEVYTSSGVNTVFTNACGDTFQMGFEEGEASYTLAADANSCAP